jgi:hypothetical protein
MTTYSHPSCFVPSYERLRGIQEYETKKFKKFKKLFEKLHSLSQLDCEDEIDEVNDVYKVIEVSYIEGNCSLMSSSIGLSWQPLMVRLSFV